MLLFQYFLFCFLIELDSVICYFSRFFQGIKDPVINLVIYALLKLAFFCLRVNVNS